MHYRLINYIIIAEIDLKLLKLNNIKQKLDIISLKSLNARIDLLLYITTPRNLILSQPNRKIPHVTSNFLIVLFSC